MTVPTEQSSEAIRVLVLDDEWAIRQMFRSALENEGCTVECVSNGRAGLHILMQQSFDVLVLDLKMEGMDGLIFLEEALNIWPWLGIVIVSGYIGPSVIPRASELGVTRILEKPVQLADLCGAVREEAARKRAEYGNSAHRSSLRVIRDHLKLLTKLGNRTMRADSLVSALRELGDVLASMLTADAVGILVAEQTEATPQVLIVARAPVGETFLTQLKNELLDRYEVLTATKLDRGAVAFSNEGKQPEDGAWQHAGSLLSVPVLAGEEFAALITVGSGVENAYTPENVSLLYHAANHISAIFLALRRMQRLATRDHLTGVFNRTRLDEELERTWLVSRRYNSTMGVVIVDLDNFKTLNDFYGHTVGDEVLREFADLLRDVARASDIIARYGGDEFVIILPLADESDARRFGQRLIDTMRTSVFCKDSHQLSLTCSIGIATSDNPTFPGTSEEVLTQADRSLFMAKRAGRNRICIWPEQTFGAVSPPEEKAWGDESETGESPEHVERIAVVDDEATICDLVKRMLKPQGYEVVTFESATDALEAIRAKPASFDVVLTDLALPGKTGIELLRDVGAIDETIVRIVMTGYATVDGAVNCLREGAYDFIQKPVRQAQLSALIKRALEYRRLRIDNARYQVHLEEMVRHRSAQLATSLEETRKAYEFTLDALVAMLDARERQTGKHSIRTRELAVTLARQMHVTGEDMESVASGAFLHDIGKIGIPDAILLKPGELSDGEWDVMKTHSEIGYNILQSSPSLKHAAEVVRSHHERYDGTGYPRGLKGDEICVGARIFSVVDAYDTMRSERVYRDQVGPEEAIAEIKRCSGTQFDPAVVKTFEEYQEEMEHILKTHRIGKA